MKERKEDEEKDEEKEEKDEEKEEKDEEEKEKDEKEKEEKEKENKKDKQKAKGPKTVLLLKAHLWANEMLSIEFLINFAIVDKMAETAYEEEGEEGRSGELQARYTEDKLKSTRKTGGWRAG
ncbi:hypothetical protein FACS189472_18530 [Alphaproteobacteria bacterium]|nr:hypothetical protein FACS189472_18530 [Alphaproteobacteria bacterium]